MRREFHHTDYPFSEQHITRTVSAADVKVGDWFLVAVAAKDKDHYYRVIGINSDDPHRTAVHLHGALSRSLIPSEDVLIVRDPVAEEPADDIESELREMIWEINKEVERRRLWGKIDDIPDLLDTKASLLIAIAEVRKKG